MNRFGAVVLASLACAGSVTAAEVTRVATAAEEQVPFLLFLDVGYSHTQELATITRQTHTGTDLVNSPELRYRNVQSQLNLDAHVGLFHGLELHLGVPLVLGEHESWSFTSSNSAAQSTITNNCLRANGTLLDPTCLTTGAGTSPLFNVPDNSWRAGLGNMHFGLAWAVFRQAHDDTKPDWVVGFDWEAPTATAIDPTVRTTSSATGPVGDKVHKYELFTSISRKYGPAEPYFKVQYIAPFNAGGSYSNCNHPSSTNMNAPGNCGIEPWLKSETGVQEPQQAGMLFGTELHAYEDASGRSYFGIDLRGVANYFSSGRYYNQLSYVMQKFLWTEEYLQVGGKFGLTAKASDWVAIRAGMQLLYNTEHALTGEGVGKDINHDGKVDLAAGSAEANPSFDYRVDAPGRQFRITGDYVFSADVTLTVIF